MYSTKTKVDRKKEPYEWEPWVGSKILFQVRCTSTRMADSRAGCQSELTVCTFIEDSLLVDRLGSVRGITTTFIVIIY